MAHTLIPGEQVTKSQPLVDGSTVIMLNRTWKANRASGTVLFDKVSIEMGADIPPALAEMARHAAKNVWVAIAATWRNQLAKGHITKAAIAEFDGLTFPIDDLDNFLGREKVTRETVGARIAKLTSGEWTKEEFQASLSPNERDIVNAMLG